MPNSFFEASFELVIFVSFDDIDSSQTQREQTNERQIMSREQAIEKLQAINAQLREVFDEISDMDSISINELIAIDKHLQPSRDRIRKAITKLNYDIPILSSN